MTYNVDYSSLTRETQEGFEYWVERTRGKIRALRRAIGDSSAEPEELHPSDLPTMQLRVEYGTLILGDLPAAVAA